MDHINKTQQLVYQSLCLQDSDSPYKKSDDVHALTVTNFPKFAQIIKSELSDHWQRIPALPFIAVMAHRLGLPGPRSSPLATLTKVPGVSYAMESCRYHDNGPQKLMDHGGNHHAGCPSGNKARYSTHSRCISVLSHFARLAGYDTTREPSAASLIGNALSPEQIKMLFPKVPNRASKERAQKIQDALTQADAISDPIAKTQVVSDAINAILPDAELVKDGSAARADCSFSNGHGKKLVCDVTIIHTTCPDYVEKNHKFLMADLLNRRNALAEGYYMVDNNDNTPAVVNAAIRKHVKYGLIERLINLQALVGAVPQHAKFVPCVISHRGELGSEFVDLLEVLATNYKQLRRLHPSADGLTPTQAATKFRCDLRHALFSALACGWGTQLISAGSPFQ